MLAPEASALPLGDSPTIETEINRDCRERKVLPARRSSAERRWDSPTACREYRFWTLLASAKTPQPRRVYPFLMALGSVLGIDLGGTKIAIGVVDVISKKIRKIETFETNAARGYDAVMDDVVAAALRIAEKDTIAIGLGVPGLVERDTRRVRSMPNIPRSENTDPRALLEKALKLFVTIDNDARCFAYSEALVGAGKGKKVVIGLTLGTGVGGGVVIEKRLYEGAHGFAAEFGHMLLVPEHPPYDTADKRGDVEQFLSGTAMGRRSEEKDPEKFVAALDGKLIREIAWFVTNLTAAFDPDMIVFGGAAGRALGSHLKEIEAELGTWMIAGMSRPQLAIAELEHAGVLGAALRTMNRE